MIPHQSILSNVELALTLSGVSASDRRKRALEALKNVGLSSHVHKRPNQLSGGQMQRVAIARALVNNPDILLADEPTGALDSKTSEQIMNLLKEVAKNRLVIMVTHNKELAEDYSTRIIELKDGHILGDSNPFDKTQEKDENMRKRKKKNMSFSTALILSFNNLLTKKGRTILTAFAGSIGIIGIALIMSLSNGVQEYIKKVEEETLTSYPIEIDKTSIDLSSVLTEQSKKQENAKNNDKNKIYSNNNITDTMSIMSSEAQTNNLKAFKNYIESDKTNIKDYTTAISYGYNLDLHLYKDDTDKVVQVEPDTVLETINMKPSGMQSMFMSSGVWSTMFENDKLNKRMFEVVNGKMPESYNEVALVVNENNQVSDYVLYAIGIKSQDELKDIYDKVASGEKVEMTNDSYDFNEIVGTKFKMLLSSDYYKKENGIWVNKKNDENYLKSKLKDAETIEIVGIIRPSENSVVSSNTMGGMLYRTDLEKYVIEKSNNADIVKDQKANKEINVLTNQKFSNSEFDMKNLSVAEQQYLASLPPEELADVIADYRELSSLTYETVLESLGAIDTNEPSSIYIYAKDFESKDEIKNIISKYNDKQEKSGKDSNVIHYSDLVGVLMSSVTNIVNIIRDVLIGFVSISLVVSSIMIGIITYISVLERTKEIGILRAIGASKKDVSRVFNAETLIVGLFSGLIGIGVTLLLNIPINVIIHSIADVKHIASLPLAGAIGLVIISVILTLIAGLIPSRMASKKDPVEALRTE